jgi:hypothetical protein
MRQGSNSGRRPRGRTNRKQHGGGPSRSHTYDSNGPDGRVRGNARQVYEKYLTLARDASSAGDRIAAEAYYQHAEHYFRILSDSTDPQPGERRSEDRQPQPYGGDDGASASHEHRSSSNGSGDETPAAAKSNGAAAPDAPQPEAESSEAGSQESEGEAPPRPRRGRPRKPRSSDDGKPRKEDASSETESGSAAS